MWLDMTLDVWVDSGGAEGSCEIGWISDGCCSGAGSSTDGEVSGIGIAI